MSNTTTKIAQHTTTHSFAILHDQSMTRLRGVDLRLTGLIALSKEHSFLSRVSILTCDIDIANLSVRLSVRYIPISDENGLTYRHSVFTAQ